MLPETGPLLTVLTVSALVGHPVVVPVTVAIRTQPSVPPAWVTATALPAPQAPPQYPLPGLLTVTPVISPPEPTLVIFIVSPLPVASGTFCVGTIPVPAKDIPKPVIFPVAPTLVMLIVALVPVKGIILLRMYPDPALAIDIPAVVNAPAFTELMLIAPPVPIVVGTFC